MEGEGGLQKLRAELKIFEASFLSENGRKPTPQDIDARPEIGMCLSPLPGAGECTGERSLKLAHTHTHALTHPHSLTHSSTHPPHPPELTRVRSFSQAILALRAIEERGRKGRAVQRKERATQHNNHCSVQLQERASRGCGTAGRRGEGAGVWKASESHALGKTCRSPSSTPLSSFLEADREPSILRRGGGSRPTQLPVPAACPSAPPCGGHPDTG